MGRNRDYGDVCAHDWRRVCGGDDVCVLVVPEAGPSLQDTQFRVFGVVVAPSVVRVENDPVLGHIPSGPHILALGICGEVVLVEIVVVVRGDDGGGVVVAEIVVADVDIDTAAAAVVVVVGTDRVGDGGGDVAVVEAVRIDENKDLGEYTLVQMEKAFAEWLPQHESLPVVSNPEVRASVAVVVAGCCGEIAERMKSAFLA